MKSIKKVRILLSLVSIATASVSMAECKILFSKCDASGLKTKLEYVETFENSANNQLRCLARAEEWSSYCKNTVAFTSTNSNDEGIIVAYFSKGSEAIAKKVAYPKSTRCSIFISSSARCPGTGGAPLPYYDNYGTSATNETRCHARAVEWRDYCDSTMAQAIFEVGGVGNSSAIAYSDQVEIKNAAGEIIEKIKR